MKKKLAKLHPNPIAGLGGMCLSSQTTREAKIERILVRGQQGVRTRGVARHCLHRNKKLDVAMSACHPSY
jgi:hypothetical protein